MVDPVKAGALGRQLNPFFLLAFVLAAFQRALTVQLPGWCWGVSQLQFPQAEFFSKKRWRDKMPRFKKTFAPAWFRGNSQPPKAGFGRSRGFAQFFFSPKIPERNQVSLENLQRKNQLCSSSICLARMIKSEATNILRNGGEIHGEESHDRIRKKITN